MLTISIRFGKMRGSSMQQVRMHSCLYRQVHMNHKMRENSNAPREISRK